MALKLLFIEDDQDLRKNLKDIFHEDEIAGHTLNVQVEESFEKGIEIIKESNFDIVILDLFKDGEQKDEDAGIKVLETIRSFLFVPVIFYTGHAYKIAEFKSEIVGIVNKGDGIEALTFEIERIIKSKLALLKKNVNEYINKEFVQYFWGIVDKQKSIFNSDGSDYSLGYLILRRIANSLSKENIKEILKDDKIKPDKAHPMEFYVFPSNNGEYESGEILLRDDVYYAILTPSCDFIQEGKRLRKVGKVLLAKALYLKETDFFKKFEGNREKYRQSIAELIESRKGDRYFFLPGAPFLPNLLLDFQNKLMFDYEDLGSFSRVAKLDDPFAQSMVSSFVRYYNRIGFPDIDSDYIIERL